MEKRSVPAAALRLTVGEFEISDRNGDGARSAPVTLKARSGDPIDHWYWGRVVHDLSGMRLGKSRVPIDYAHDDKEVIGYLNRFDASSGDLLASGALVPFRDSDRATEVIYKSKEGVPYEASIFFGGDGVVMEEIAEGASVEVNGRAFAGPGVVIREWPLRGVAICPYGADANTEARLSAKSETVEVRMTKKEETQMAEQAEEVAATEPVAQESEASTAPATSEAEQQTIESDPEAETAKLAAVEAGIRERAQAFAAAFGEAKGALYLMRGLSLAEAEKAFAAEAVEERDALRRELTELKARLAAVAGSGTAPSGGNAPAPESGKRRFLDEARKLQAEKGITFAAAASALASLDPQLYRESRKG